MSTIITRFDFAASTKIAKALRAEGISLAEIGAKLKTQGLSPMHGGVWHPAQVRKLLATVSEAKDPWDLPHRAEP